MKSGKPQDQSLAIAYSIKRKNSRKKMANGGMAYKNDSAKTESRPSTQETDNDSKMVSQNSNIKPANEDRSTDDPTVRQAQKPSTTKLSRPKMVGSDGFSVRDRDDVEKDLDRIDTEYPESDKAQPRKRYDEEGPNRQGSSVTDMQAQHNNRKAPYIKEVEDQYSEDVANPNMKKTESPLGRYAEGGMVHEMDDQPTDEADEERHASIAAAIMMKKAKLKEHMDSGSADMDEMVRMYKGGQVEGSDESQTDVMLNGKEHPNAYVPRNKNEVLKENYMNDMKSVSQPEDSNEHGDSREDETSDPHDMIDMIRRKIKAKRAK